MKKKLYEKTASCRFISTFGFLDRGNAVNTTHQSLNEVSIPLQPTHRDRIAPFTLFILIISAIFTIIYIGLFTPFGNSKVSNYLENELSSLVGSPVTVSTFSLTSQALTLEAYDEHNNVVHIKSRFHLFPPFIDGNYSVDFPSHLNPLETPVQTVGKIVGTYRHITLIGNGEIFNTAMDYNVTLASLKPCNVQFSINHLDYSKLMKYLEYPHDSDTVVDGNISIGGIDTRNIAVEGFLNAKTTRFSPSPLKVDDNESFDFWELLADKNGKIQPFKIAASLDASVDELGIVEQFVSYPLRTPATAHVSINGTQHSLMTDVAARIAKGDVKASLKLHKLKPYALNANIRSIDASTLFSLLSLPQPMSGKLGGTVESDFTTTTLALVIKEGQTNPKNFKKYYGLTQPLMHFEADFSTKITPKSTQTSGVFTSNLRPLAIDGSPAHDVMMRELLRQIKSKGL